MGNCCGFPSLPEQNLSSNTNPSTPGALKNSSNNTDLSVSATTSSSNCRSQFSQTVSEIVEENPDGEMLEIPNLIVYTFSDMKAATKSFKTDSLGQGGFGKVFKGWVDEKTLQPSNPKNGMLVAIKKLNPESMQGYEEWQSEVNFLGRLSHPNLVKLLGYCLEDKELLLVYEFMAKGSLENHLFRRNPAIEPLSWDLRMKIAIGAAKGLAFLHTSDKHVIYRDFKASNILLDSNFNAKISDFGLARLGPSGEESHVTTRIMGTYGYAAPEYVATGHLYVKSDVFGFGVVLLEMMTGLRALDTKRPNGQQNLVDWLKPCLPHKRKVKHMMDARIQGQYSPKAAWQAAELTLKCLEGDHRKRPSMKEVVDDLEKIEALKLKGKEKARQPGSGNTSSLQQQHAWSYSKFRTNNGS